VARALACALIDVLFMRTAALIALFSAAVAVRLLLGQGMGGSQGMGGGPRRCHEGSKGTPRFAGPEGRLSRHRGRVRPLRFQYLRRRSYQEIYLGDDRQRAAIIDFDNDGKPDIFLVNGSRLNSAQKTTSRLYRNEGMEPSAMSRKIRADPNRLGTGRLRRRFRQRRPHRPVRHLLWPQHPVSQSRRRAL